MRTQDITADLVQALPEPTRLQLTKDAARLQDVDLLRTLDCAGMFDPPAPIETSELHDQGIYNAKAYAGLAALGHVLSRSSSVMEDVDRASGVSFSSAVTYDIRTIEIKDAFRQEFRGIVGRYLARHALLEASLDALFHSDDLSGLERASVVCKERHAGTCGILLAIAAAIDDAVVVGSILSHRGAEPSPCEAFADPCLAGHTLVSIALIEPVRLNVRTMVHPAFVAMRYASATALQAFFANGYRPGEHVLMVTRETPEVDPSHASFFAPAEQDDWETALQRMESGGLCVLPSVMAQILPNLSPRGDMVERIGRPAAQSLLSTSLTLWARTLVTGDEPELDMVRLAHRHGVYDNAPNEMLMHAFSNACPDLVELVADKVDWRALPDDRPLRNLFESRWWTKQGSSVESFCERAIVVLIDEGQERRLLMLLNGPAGETQALQEFAEKGFASCVLKCLELGADPLASRDSMGWNVLEMAQATHQTEVARVIKSFLARKEAEAVINDLDCSSAN